jgi:hypothetical protein
MLSCSFLNKKVTLYSYSDRSKNIKELELSGSDYFEMHSRIERTFKEVGGTKPHEPSQYGPWKLHVSLHKPSNAPLQKDDNRHMYLNIDEKEIIAVVLGKFGDDLAVKPLQDYASISPLTAIEALSSIRSDKATAALRSMLYNHYHGSTIRSYDKIDGSNPQSYEEWEIISALEKIITGRKDYEGCREIIKANSNESRYLVLATFKQIMGNNEIWKDRGLLMILLKNLGAFPANSHKDWVDNYYDWEADDYGYYKITGKLVIADSIGRYFAYFTLEQFKEYMRNLDLELLKDEEVLNHLVTLIAEYPNTLEENPIAIALQRIDPKTRVFFLKRYMALCEDWKGWKSPPMVNLSIENGYTKPWVSDLIGSLKHWLSTWEK